MAAVKGTLITLLDARSIASTNQIYGRVRVCRDTYVAAALEANSTIAIGRVPAGASILPQSTIHWDALGSGTGFVIGINGATANLGGPVSTVVGSRLAATGQFFHPATSGYVSPVATDLYLTTFGTMTGTITVTTLFVMD